MIRQKGKNNERIIKELERENKVISGINDSVFKSLFQAKETRGILAYIISEILHISPSYILNNLSFKPTEMVKEKYYEHGKITDLLVEIKGTILNLEMNQTVSAGVITRNTRYHQTLASHELLESDDYMNVKKIIQINFDYINTFDDRLVIRFRLVDDEGKFILDENFINFHINMEKVRKKYYNKIKLTRFEKIIMLLQEESKDKLKEIAGEDKELKSMVKKIEEMSYDPNIIGLYDKEKSDRYIHDIDVATAKEEGIAEGIKHGSKQEKIQIARNMLNDQIDIETVIKYTGLTKEKIENL